MQILQNRLLSMWYRSFRCNLNTTFLIFTILHTNILVALLWYHYARQNIKSSCKIPLSSYSHQSSTFKCIQSFDPMYFFMFSSVGFSRSGECLKLNYSRVLLMWHFLAKIHKLQMSCLQETPHCYLSTVHGCFVYLEYAFL